MNFIEYPLSSRDNIMYWRMWISLGQTWMWFWTNQWLVTNFFTWEFCNDHQHFNSTRNKLLVELIMCALSNTCQKWDIIEMACINDVTTWPLSILFFCKQSSHLEHQMKNVNMFLKWCYVNTPIHDTTSLPIKSL
jgi:hypothetical protein